MNTAKKGAAFENEVKHLLQSDGYEVGRARGSKGTWDLVAIKTQGRHRNKLYIMLLQAKRWKIRKEASK